MFPIHVDRYLSVSVLSHTWTDCMLIYSDRFANTPVLSTKCCHCDHVYPKPHNLRRHISILFIGMKPLHAHLPRMIFRYILHKNQLLPKQLCGASVMQSKETHEERERTIVLFFTSLGKSCYGGG